MSETPLTEAQYDAITEAAAQWCMRLHEPDCTRRERHAFAEWLNANPLHASEYEAVLDIWDVSTHLPRSAPTEAQVIAPRRSPWQRFAVAAAITLLAAPVAAFSLRQSVKLWWSARVVCWRMRSRRWRTCSVRCRAFQGVCGLAPPPVPSPS